MELLQNYFVAASFILGAAIGSFLNVVILRLPEEESLNGRSYCMNCKHKLGVFDLVPLFSFIFLGGKCRYCRHKISPRYFFIETLTACLFALACFQLRPEGIFDLVSLLKYFTVISALIAVFTIDLEHFLILDAVVFPSLSLVATLSLVLDILSKQSVLSSSLLEGVITGILAALPFFLLWYFSKGKWMGFGDVKLALFLGIALGWPLTGVGIFLAFVFGGIVSAFVLLLTNKTLKSKLPLGTFLSVGAVLALFYGNQLLGWYLALLGF